MKTPTGSATKTPARNIHQVAPSRKPSAGKRTRVKTIAVCTKKIGIMRMERRVRYPDRLTRSSKLILGDRASAFRRSTSMASIGDAMQSLGMGKAKMEVNINPPIKVAILILISRELPESKIASNIYPPDRRKTGKMLKCRKSFSDDP